MEVRNGILPSDPDQVRAMGERGPGGPIVLLSLLRFRARARYPDGRDAGLSGRAAYARFGVRHLKLLEQAGGRILYVGDVSQLAIGYVEDLWDQVVLTEYPSRSVLVDLTLSDAWREIAVHREAGLEGQLSMETVGVPLEAPSRAAPA